MVWLYFVLMCLVFLGFIIGLVLAKIAPEELESGAPIFIRLQDIIYNVIILSIMYYSLQSIVIIPLILGLVFYWYKENLGAMSYAIEFASLGIFLGISYYLNLFVVCSALIFVYNLAAGTLLKYHFQNLSFLRLLKKVLTRLIFFMIGSAIPFILTEF